MQLRHFVTICSVVLMGWLALTFIHEVPTNRYRVPAPVELSPAAQLEEAEQSATVIAESDELAVSVSP